MATTLTPLQAQSPGGERAGLGIFAEARPRMYKRVKENFVATSLICQAIKNHRCA